MEGQVDQAKPNPTNTAEDGEQTALEFCKDVQGDELAGLGC